MSRDSLREYKMICNGCNKEHSILKWDSCDKQELCYCDKKLPLFFKEEENKSTDHFANLSIGGKFKNGRSKEERETRRLNDFKKNDYNHIPEREKNYFRKKHGWKD